MITKKHVEIYKKYGGSMDGLSLVGTAEDMAIVGGGYWGLIDNLKQDWIIVKNELAADAYAKSIEERFQESCDSEETIMAITY